jgi:hypothetical protein
MKGPQLIAQGGKSSRFEDAALRPSQGLSRRYSAGIVAPRPECDGRIVGCEGVEAIQ